ncbi:MAG TPA: PilZ domain-containing protein [Gemmataceae bacterium]|nr:PilZ domain-containing protein [Gemmataceae bacterium]
MNMSRPKSGADPKRERRAEPRYSANPDASCRVSATDDPESQSAEIDNISARGIKVLVQRGYEVGTFLLVQLTGKNRHLERTVMVRVVRVTAEASGKYALGCAFLTPLEGYELFTLVL